MQLTTIFRQAIVIAGSFITFIGALSAAAQPKPPISVEDLARFATIGDPLSLSWNDGHRSVRTLSPDGNLIAVVIRLGNPERGTNDATLQVYRKADLFHQPRAEVLAEFASSNSRQPIAYVRWLADNETLMFAATPGDELSQIYKVSTRTRQVIQLTQLTDRLEWYDVTSDGRWIATLTKQANQPPRDNPDCRRSACRITARSLWAAEEGVFDGSTVLSMIDTRGGEARRFEVPENIDESITRCDDDLALSPDGRFAIRACGVHRWPSWWTGYMADPDLRPMLERGNTYYARVLMLVDTRRGTTTRLSEAPARWDSPRPLWIDGGRSLILPAALEPLTDITSSERRQRVEQYATLSIDPSTLQATRIGRIHRDTGAVVAASWDQRTGTLSITTERSRPRHYRRNGTRWTTSTAPAMHHGRSAGSIDLVIEQSLNERPMLMAMDAATAEKRPVLDPNPWLVERVLGRVEAIQWPVKTGFWSGGLYYPPAYAPGKRYPLVIQTHGFEKDEFSLHGIARNFPGQALAAHDIVVLQVEEKDADVVDTPAEWPTVQAGYEAAIDELDRRGLIDRARVGIQGWSRTGPQSGYTLTHSSYPFAAGAFTDSGDFGWWYYLSRGGLIGGADSFYGAPPFGEGLKRWLEHAPSFNLDRVRTPMLMWEADSAIGLWDWYAGLERLGKPVEYWVIPDGSHDVFQVGQRMHTNRLLVDWFRFWLKDEQDPDPAKAEQYERWRKLREQQRASLAEPLRPIENSAPSVAPAR